MFKGRFLFSGTIGVLLVISNAANGISDPDFISQVKAARKKQNQKDLFDMKGFVTSIYRKNPKCLHKEMQTSLSKKTQKFLREVSNASVCLDCYYDAIHGCNCHPTCSECGWDEEFECELDHHDEIGVDGPGNCFACADGSEVVPLTELHSGWTLSHGLCGGSSSCYGEDDEIIPHCECDSHCSICYRGEYMGEEEYECFVCNDGSFLWNDCEDGPEPLICGQN